MNIFKEIQKLNLPLGQYVVVGSGPMAARGIREIQDIDIVVTPELFEKCKQEGWEQILWTYEKPEQIYLKKGFVELYLDVNCGNFNPTIEELLQRADIINNIPFVSLADLVRFKKEYNKPKHLKDIKLIEKYIKDNPTNIMTVDKIREVLAIYRKKFEELGISQKQLPHNLLPKSDNDFLAHCHGMLDEMEIFIQEGRMEKVFRWLGFIQGCLWRIGIYTIEEIKSHNRP